MSYKLYKTYALGANEGSGHKATQKIAFIHSTANVGASAKNNAAYEKRTWSNAYVHFIAGDGVVYQVGQPGYEAWGVGPTGNAMAPVQIEMEETNDSAKFKRIYATTIELLRDMSKKYGFPLTLDTAGSTGIKSHKWAANKWHETDHTDPYGYLSKHGISKARFAKDIAGGKTTAKKSSYIKTVKQVKAKTRVSRYHDKAFKKKADSFPAGTVFDIASVVSYGKITRLKLANGLYITSNTDYVKKTK